MLGMNAGTLCCFARTPSSPCASCAFCVRVLSLPEPAPPYRAPDEELDEAELQGLDAEQQVGVHGMRACLAGAALTVCAPYHRSHASTLHALPPRAPSQTLWCGNTAADQLLQITHSSVRLLDCNTKQVRVCVPQHPTGPTCDASAEPFAQCPTHTSRWCTSGGRPRVSASSWQRATLRRPLLLRVTGGSHILNSQRRASWVGVVGGRAARCRAS